MLCRFVCTEYTGDMGRKKLGRDRINITLPTGMADELLDAANAEGRDRSEVIAELARGWLRKKAKEKRKAAPRPAKRKK